MLPEQQSRLIVVLVRARNPLNIGAVARAMHDFGFSQLRIVNDFAAPFEAAVSTEQAAAKAAVHATSVLASATAHATLADAVADCTFVLGTTAVGDRKLDHRLHTLAAATPLIHNALGPESGKVALLFGSEKTGLSNEELSLCHALITIPMSTAAGRHLSMNLGQAAAVCLYALSSETAERSTAYEVEDEGSRPATSADLDRLTRLLLEVFDQSGYTGRHPANSRPNTVARLVRRMSHSADDAAVWSGILRQILHTLKP